MTDRSAPRAEELFNAEAGTPGWRRSLKASEAGRIAAALYRRRRLPRQILAAPSGLRSPHPPVPAPADRRRARVVCWMPGGPGASEGLLDTWASAVASSPGEVGLLVTDDWTGDCHAAAITARVPGAVVVRTRVPSGGPPRLWPVTALAIRAASAHFDFDLLVKLDTDALVVGPGWAKAIADAIAQLDAAAAVDEPGEAAGRAAPIGIAGAFRDRPDGGREVDEPYHQRVLAGELPRDPVVADWHRRALAGGWPHGSIVQGGCLVLTRALCQAIADEGALDYVPRLRTIVSEDLLLTVLAYVLGFRAASLGGPDGPLAIANKHLPLPLGELLDPTSRWLVAHSTKVGIDGESEREIRERARAARGTWPAG